VSTLAEACLFRDQMMLKNIVDNAPKDRKLKVLEMGAGRGGLTRFVAKELLKLDKLEIIVAANISERENQYSRNKAKEENIPEAVYRVDHYSYDTMPYSNSSFDVILSNEAILYAEDKVRTMARAA